MDGQATSATQTTFRIEQPAEAGADSVELVMETEVGPGPHVLVVGLRDEASREASYVSTSIQVQEPAPSDASR